MAVIMKVIMVHGWSVTHTDTYGELPQALVRNAKKFNLKIKINHIHLGKYVSFNDQVTVDDVATAFDTALQQLLENKNGIQPFSCITHSTGGPVVRRWIDKFYGAKGMVELPLKHLVMLAPANQGSALATLGKKQVSRIKAWFSGVEPGLKILDWLCLGSQGQWSLNRNFLNYQFSNKGFYPFVLTGQGIDTKFYDFINNYLVESGSDGVVRVAAANLNYRVIYLKQTNNKTPGKFSKTFYLESKTKKLVLQPSQVPLGVFSALSHSGKKMGIMASRKKNQHHQLLVHEILKCFQVEDENSFQNRITEFESLTANQQRLVPAGKKNPISRYCMLVFNIHDENGNTLDKDDFDLFLLAGSKYSPNDLPKGFFRDRQINHQTSNLVYFLDADKMLQIKNQLLGFRVVARPSRGFCYFQPAEFSTDKVTVEQIIAVNTTTYIDIELKRQIDQNVFRFANAKKKRESFKRTKPSGKSVL